MRRSAALNVLAHSKRTAQHQLVEVVEYRDIMEQPDPSLAGSLQRVVLDQRKAASDYRRPCAHYNDPYGQRRCLYQVERRYERHGGTHAAAQGQPAGTARLECLRVRPCLYRNASPCGTASPR